MFKVDVRFTCKTFFNQSLPPSLTKRHAKTNIFLCENYSPRINCCTDTKNDKRKIMISQIDLTYVHKLKTHCATKSTTYYFNFFFFTKIQNDFITFIKKNGIKGNGKRPPKNGPPPFCWQLPTKRGVAVFRGGRFPFPWNTGHLFIIFCLFFSFITMFPNKDPLPPLF